MGLGGGAGFYERGTPVAAHGNNKGFFVSFSFSLFLPLSLCMSRSLTLALSTTLSIALSLVRLLSFSISHYLPLSLSLSRSPALSLSLSRSLSLSCSRARARALSLLLPFSLSLCTEGDRGAPIVLSEEGTTHTGFRTFTGKPRPEIGHAYMCHICLKAVHGLGVVGVGDFAPSVLHPAHRYAIACKRFRVQDLGFRR